jgi:hypothetical protein
MPWGLKRFHSTRQPHYLTFSCYKRRPNFRISSTLVNELIGLSECTAYRSHAKAHSTVSAISGTLAYGGSAEVVDQHDGLFPLIDLKEDEGLPVG